MSLIPYLIVVMLIAGEVIFASEEDKRPKIESGTNCTVTNRNENSDEWRVSCNMKGHKDLIIDIGFFKINVRCDEKNNSNSLPFFFPEIHLQVKLSLNTMEVINCTSSSYAEIISKLRVVKLMAEGEGSTKIIEIFGKEVSLTNEQISNLQMVQRLELVNNNIRSIKPGDFLPLVNLDLFTLEDCCAHFQSGTYTGLRRLNTLTLIGNNIRVPVDVFNDLTYIVYIDYQINSVSLLPENMFKNTKILETIDITHTRVKTLPNNLFSNLTHLLFVRLNDNGLEQLPPNIFRNCTRLAEIILSKNSIKSVPEDLLTDLTKLEILDLRNNAIGSLSRHLFQNQKELTHLYLSNNKLYNIAPTIKILLKHSTLRVLDLRYNDMDISMDLLKVMQAHGGSLEWWLIKGNTMKCDCDTLNVLSSIPTARKLTDLKGLMCGDGKPFTDIEVESFCDYTKIYVIVGAVICTPILLLPSALALYYKYQTEVKVFLYARGCCLRWITEEELDKDKKYDVFISFSHKDEPFVMNELVRQLEGPPYHHRVCVHYRDWFAGVSIGKQIVESIESSKRTLIVLTPDFLDSKWSTFEFRIAHYNTLKERRIRLIALIYKDIGNLEHIDGELNAYLRTNTYLKWGDPWFWDKLNYALPHSCSGNADIEMNPIIRSMDII